MVNNIGDRLRYYRLKLGQKQKDLSDGIISTSYLSKIENGEVDAAREIIELLSKRLNVDLYQEDAEDLNLYIQWYHSLLIGDKDKVKDHFNAIRDSYLFNSNSTYKNMINLHKLSYYTLMGYKIEEEKQFSMLTKITKNFSNSEMYYWNKFSGDYHFSNMCFKKALSSYQEAENFVETDIFFKLEEKYDLYYLISLTASQIRQPYIPFIYAPKAIEYYQSTYNLKRCAECHIILGVAYRRINDFEKSKLNFKLTAEISQTLNNKRLMSLTQQNLGKLYSTIGESDLAIESYLKSYELRENELPADKIIPVSSLMKEYYLKRNDKELAIQWLEKGLELLESLTPLDSIYVYEFEMYKFILADKKDNSFERLIIKQILPFLEKNQLFYEEHKYLMILADHLNSTRKYKLASKYYKEANMTLMKIYESR